MVTPVPYVINTLHNVLTIFITDMITKIQSKCCFCKGLYYISFKKVVILQITAIHRLTWSDIVFVEI